MNSHQVGEDFREFNPNGPASPASRVGDRLRQAREIRGITLAEVSAAIRVRVPTLEAFEREEHAQLPPRVYALGQLRTYATYLGLDAGSVAAAWPTPASTLSSEQLVSQDRSASAKAALRRLSSLRPGVIRSSRGFLALGGLGLAVLVISGFMVVQLLRFILPPSIAITYPVEEVSALAPGTLSFELKGTADARATVMIATSAGAQLTTQADQSGLWRLLVPLGTGRTEIVAHAVKPGTGGESSSTAERVFLVALPDKTAPDLVVTQPTANQSVENADVPLALLTDPNIEIVVTATDTTGGLISSMLRSNDGGQANGAIPLPAGRWTLSFSVTAADGTLNQATRTVEVSFRGVTVSVTGGVASTWIRLWVDGQIDPTIGASGKTITPGARLIFSGAQRIEIRSGDHSMLSYTLNGRTISQFAGSAGSQTYAFLSTGKVQPSSRR